MNVEYIARITCSCGTIIEVETYAATDSYGYAGTRAYIDHDGPPD